MPTPSFLVASPYTIQNSASEGVLEGQVQLLVVLERVL